MFEYSELERYIKPILKEKLLQEEEKKLMPLYYMYGAFVVKDKLNFEIKKHKINSQTIEYKEDKMFDNFSLNNLVKVLLIPHISLEIPNEVNSLQNKIFFELPEALEKLIRTRNIIAHETSYVKIKEENVVERLSKQKILENLNDIITEDEFKNLSDEEIAIASNLCYIRKIYKIFSEI